jgi:type I restriction enzyme, S subunit
MVNETGNTIPKHWQVKKLGEVCDKLSLNKIKIKQRDYLQEGKYPVVDQGQELIGGYYNDENFVVPNEPPYIIFGDHTKVKKFVNFKFIAGADGVKVLKSKSNTDPRFLYYAIHSIKIDDKGYARHFQLLEKSDFPLPPLPEQHAIVSKIEELFSELDNGKQQLQTALQQLKVYRQSLLKAAFEGKLTNKNVKDGELPEGWIIKKLNEIGTWKGGGTPSKSKIEFWENGNVLWVSPKDMKSQKIYDTIDKITKDAIENSSTKLIPKDSILFVVRSGILRRTLPIAMTVSEVTVNQDLQALTPKDVLAEYVYWYVSAKNDDIRKTCSKDGTTVESIESSLLKNCLIPICSREEQQLIVQELESKLTVCDKIEETITQSLQQAETLRQSILKKAFDGELITERKEHATR